MMTFYAAAGSYQIRSEDGKNMPYIMRLGKLQPVSIPEFSLWSMLLWDVLTYEELHKKFYDKMEETEIEPSSFDKSLEMLVKRKLIIKGVGYTGADALYNMLSDTYVIPLRGVQGTRKLMNVAKLLKQKKVNFFEAVYLLQPEKSSVAERTRPTMATSRFLPMSASSSGTSPVLSRRAMMRTPPRVIQSLRRRAPARFTRSRRSPPETTMTTISPSDQDMHIWAVSVFRLLTAHFVLSTQIYI